MLAEKVFIGERLDLQHYKGVPIQEHEFEILDKDGEAADLSEFDSFTWTLYSKAHGKELEEVEVPIPAANILLLSVPGEPLNIRPTFYFYECAGHYDASPSEHVILFYGVFDIIRS